MLAHLGGAAETVPLFWGEGSVAAEVGSVRRMTVPAGVRGAGGERSGDFDVASGRPVASGQVAFSS